MGISEKTQKFINEHAKDDLNALRLKYAGKSAMMDIPLEFALIQIEARRKAQRKIPSFLIHEDFVFPDTLAAEQASNEAVAKFHASLLNPGTSLLDLTAGLGIDDLTFAKNGTIVTACEINKTKANALRHNAEILGLESQLKVINIDSIDYLKACDKHYDVVFADPARRSESGRRLHALADCQPDIEASMDTIMSLSDRLIIKSSPLLDLSLIRDTVENLRHIYVVCFKGEGKEVLIDIQKESSFEGVTVVDLDWEGEISRFFTQFDVIKTENKVPECDRKKASDYRFLYEPNAGIMKTGAWNSISAKYPELNKADKNTHLFLSDKIGRAHV